MPAALKRSSAAATSRSVGRPAPVRPSSISTACVIFSSLAAASSTATMSRSRVWPPWRWSTWRSRLSRPPPLACSVMLPLMAITSAVLGSSPAGPLPSQAQSRPPTSRSSNRLSRARRLASSSHHRRRRAVTAADKVFEGMGLSARGEDRELTQAAGVPLARCDERLPAVTKARDGRRGRMAASAAQAPELPGLGA
ncbi:hypothetical protein RA210_U20450 [Rubrivivax sp. A210]|nr:hypothetical protein RA210_U20450 [Rubrivivax sp. A210]